MHTSVTHEQDGSRSAPRSSGDLLEQAMREHRTSLFHYIYRFVGDYDAASDICQQVFVQLYLSLPHLHSDRSLTAWLFQVAHNCCIDETRRKRAICFSELEANGWRTAEDEEPSLLSVLPDQGPLPEEETEQHDLQRRLCAAISALPPKLRGVVSLRYAAEMSYGEIGVRLHMPPGTAKTYFHRAKPLLRRLLTEQGLSPVA